VHVLVTGATGLIGSAVARELAARGHRVRALVRATSDVAPLEGLGAEIARGDVLDRESVRLGLAGCDAVIHVAGLASFRPDHRERLFAINVGGVETVLGAALEAGVRRAVSTSSYAVTLGDLGAPRAADEETPPNAEALGIPYLVSKLRGERAALAFAARGLAVAAVRPGYVLGPGGGRGTSASTILALARRRLPVYVEGGVPFCDVRDVARGHVDALERGRAGEVYLLGGHNLEMSALVRLVAALTGVPPPRRLPRVVALAAAWAAEAVARARGRSATATVDLVRANARCGFVSSAKAERELGYAVRPLEDTLRDTLRWYLAQGALAAATPELRALTAA
jgi:dihydroflavonol-4-reductase